MAQGARDSNKVTPKTQRSSPKTVSSATPKPGFNPYELGAEICYGYGGVNDVGSSKKTPTSIKEA